MSSTPVVKKTVALHPMMDRYIRKTWSLLIEAGYDATYSTALNFMLLGSMYNAILQKHGWSKEARKYAWGFMNDDTTINELNDEDRLSNLRKQISLAEFDKEEIATIKSAKSEQKGK